MPALLRLLVGDCPKLSANEPLRALRRPQPDPERGVRPAAQADLTLERTAIPPERPGPMFSISDKDIAAIQAAFERGGELAARIEVRRLFPGIPDNADARRIAFIIAGFGWRPMSEARPPHEGIDG